MITPRRIRLFRAPDLAGYRQFLVELARDLDPAGAVDTFILVPTRAAAEQLARTLKNVSAALRFGLPTVGLAKVGSDRARICTTN